jgi:hypothetical protein
MKNINSIISGITTAVVCLVMSFSVFGQNKVDLNLATRVGENFIKMNTNVRLSGREGSLQRVQTDKFPNLYIFNADGQGWIIVAGDKRIPPILGFSDVGTFNPNNMAPAAEMIVGGYDYVVDSLVRYNVRATDESVALAWRDLEEGYYKEEKGVQDEEPKYPLSYGPLISDPTFYQGSIDHWQDSYNKYCPKYEDVANNRIYKAYTGCSATSMAQLIYHYKRKPKDIQNIIVEGNSVRAFRGTFSNEGNVQLILMGIDEQDHTFQPYPSALNNLFEYYDWNYSDKRSYVEQSARLMYYCGLRIRSGYKLNKQIIQHPGEPDEIVLSGETSATLDNIQRVLQTSFSFPKAFIKPQDNSNWNDTLKKYISHDIPLIYSAEKNNGRGHQYIIDGYKTTNVGVLFHHIFGNQNSDGPYLLDYSEQHPEQSSPYTKHQFFLSILPIKDKCKLGSGIICLKSSNNGLKNSQETNQLVYESITKYYEYMDAMSYYLSHVIGGTYWLDEEKGIAFWNLFQSLLDDNTGMISESGIQQLINQNQFEEISEDLIMSIAERYNQSVLYWNEGYYTKESLPEGYGNMIEYDTAAMRKAYEAQAYAESLGFSDVRQMYDNAYEMLEAEVVNQQTSVCASVTMQFAQKMTMTREAFNGTLQIFNGHESTPMEDILVDFRIEDQQGNDCTNLFQINTLSLDQITGISGNGSLAAQTNGTALVQFIPTKNAAPTEPKVYSFGGSFSFIDPFTGEGLTYPLYPVEITVNPSPDLYVDYFMQRDILGDDALTTDVVEPTVPAELGVIIHNQGAGEAKNVTLETAEPQIIDNEKGLAIDFAMYGASFNGSPRQLGLTSIPFGNIGSGQTAVGEWLFTSSLLGHFISYEAHVIHNSSYGNSDLSLVSHLDIHELIHPIYAYGNLDDGINDFLVNDNPDAYDTPDSIYFSQGGKTSVGVVDDISFDHLVSPSDTIVTLTVEPSRVGWNYGVTDDPGMNQYNIVSCIRNNDNQVIPLNNVWLTFVTIPDGGDPVYENKLHIVDTLSNDVQDFTYTLVYSLKNNLLDVLEITGIPESYIDYPLESFTVRFNEAIIDSTFTYEDMTLKCQNGPNLMDSTIVITKVNDSIYDVNISGLTNETGLYVLNVSTLNIKDSRGYNGYKGKQVTWVQVIEGYTQTMNFAQGWNWWSTYIEQEGINGLSILENGLGENGVGILSQADGFTYYYSDYGWYGTLADIHNESSYKINTNEPCTAVMTGQVAVPSQHPITLSYGWTWLGYVPLATMDINEALSGLEATVGDRLKSQESYSEFYADGWYGSLSTIEPGTGLMYYSSNEDPVTFTYPDNTRSGELRQNLTAENNHWKPNVYAYPDNMTVMAVVELDDKELTTDNYELTAFAANGECRGSVKLIYAEPLHRHVAFLTISGKDAAELNFRLYDTETGMEYYDAEESLDFVANAIVGEADDLYTIHFRGTTGMDELAGKVQVYPNPVNAGERFSINVADDVKTPVRVEIVNALGVETLRATSVQMPAQLTAPATAGVYTLRITVEGKGTVVRKLVVK